jgi:DNA mismatch endonuclease, patch repair protein
MADVLTPPQRFRCMSSIRSRDTGPELLLHHLIRSAGYRRFDVNDPTLPGTPDVVFPRRRKVIFVHGCFWHRHTCKAGRSAPSTRRLFWARKLRANKERDRRCISELRRGGWEVLVVWQCQLEKRRSATASKIVAFLSQRRRSSRPLTLPCSGHT